MRTNSMARPGKADDSLQLNGNSCRRIISILSDRRGNTLYAVINGLSKNCKIDSGRGWLGYMALHGLVNSP